MLEYTFKKYFPLKLLCFWVFSAVIVTMSACSSGPSFSDKESTANGIASMSFPVGYVNSNTENRDPYLYDTLVMYSPEGSFNSAKEVVSIDVYQLTSQLSDERTPESWLHAFVSQQYNGSAIEISNAKMGKYSAKQATYMATPVGQVFSRTYLVTVCSDGTYLYVVTCSTKQIPVTDDLNTFKDILKTFSINKLNSSV